MSAHQRIEDHQVEQEVELGDELRAGPCLQRPATSRLSRAGGGGRCRTHRCAGIAPGLRRGRAEAAPVVARVADGMGENPDLGAVLRAALRELAQRLQG